MTWEWVVLILGVLLAIVATNAISTWQSIRTEQVKRSPFQAPQLREAKDGNS